MISIIIPMYNAEQTIERTLNSVKSQTYKDDIEVIIVNDGSKDKSEKIVESYKNKNPEMNILLINQENGGVSRARNTGLKNANGNYIAFLDSDDEWYKEKTEIQMNLLKCNPKIDFLGCARNDEVIRILFKKVNKLYKINVKDLFIKMFPQTSTVIFKRELYDKNGGFDETMTHAEDGDLWIRFCNSSNFYFLPQSLVVTGGGKPSYGHSGLSANLSSMYRGNLKILKKSLENKIISRLEYNLLFFFYVLKYYRRIVITKLKY